MSEERSGYRKGIRNDLRQKYEIIETLKPEYGTEILIYTLKINRSGYYKWVHRKEHLPQYELKRKALTELLKAAHNQHKTYGYHRLAAIIRPRTNLVFSDHLAHVCAKTAEIRSETKHYKYKPSGEEHYIYKNEVAGNWNAKEPLELVASDMTVIRNRGHKYEWTFIVDTFSKEIIASSISSKAGDRRTYFDCLEQLKSIIKDRLTNTTLHTDQGSVYASAAFYEAHFKTNILRSMSRAGTPTDNPIIESINGWVKPELYQEFGFLTSSNPKQTLNEYITYYNTERPSFTLNYKTPYQFRADKGFP